MEEIDCPLCGSRDRRLLFKRRDYTFAISDEAFCVVRCNHCSLIYVNPRPTELEIQAYYPEEFYETSLTAAQVLGQRGRQLQLKYGFLQDLIPGKLLDIGCNKGEFLYYMKQKGWEVQGLDFSHKVPNVFGLDIFYGSLEEIGYPPGSFDLITLWAALEHIYDPMKTLARINPLLKSGGTLILAVTNFHCLPAAFMRHDDVPRHTTLFTRRTLGLMLRRSGFLPRRFDFSAELYGGSHRGLLNYLTKLVAGEALEEIVAMNRTQSRWSEFSSFLGDKMSPWMQKIDRWDQALAPFLDRWMDRLHLGFIMICRATREDSQIA